MCDPPLISILTPVWNEQKYLPAMLESLIAQPYQRWECLVVDDGSTDRSVEIIREFGAADSRISLVAWGERLGKVAAFNLAFSKATGDLVCHLGGDDLATPDALTARADALGDSVTEEAVGYFKLRMFSEDPEKGTVLPRGTFGSRSGPSTTLTMPLARRVFPVPGHLPSEDLWIGEAARGLASREIHSQTVVVNYRVHPGNSNPRNKAFGQMSQSIHARMAFMPALLAETRFTLSPEVRDDLSRKAVAESLRWEGRTAAVLKQPLPVIDRLAIAAMSRPSLWFLRTRAYRLLSGWRRA